MCHWNYTVYKICYFCAKWWFLNYWLVVFSMVVLLISMSHGHVPVSEQLNSS